MEAGLARKTTTLDLSLKVSSNLLDYNGPFAGAIEIGADLRMHLFDGVSENPNRILSFGQ